MMVAKKHRSLTMPRPKTLEIKPRTVSEIIKPQEMIEMVEMAPLSLASRRIVTLLFKTVQEQGIEVEQFSIEKRLLRGAAAGLKTNATERLGQNIREIMGIIVERRVGRQVHRFHLLGENRDDDETDDDDALFHYTIPEPLRNILGMSEVWARLESRVIYAFSSKYALGLYEIVALRSNLAHKTSEVFPLDKFRGLIGVEEGKLPAFKSLKQFAIAQAVREVNGLCPDFNVRVDEVMTGRKVTAVKVTWWAKSAAQKAVAKKEIEVSKVGRQARLAGIVESIVEPPKIAAKAGRTLPKKNYKPGWMLLGADDIQAGRDKLKALGIDRDVYEVQADWERAVEDEGIPLNSARLNFLYFIGGLKNAKPMAAQSA
jgi:plasmid replication initiation protein